ncbi:MAG TPA: flagellar biosynthesis protein FlgH [Rhodopirellula sp.]|nr:flagellar biosynthesis protein FlgH [Rhodopirellula sp.]
MQTSANMRLTAPRGNQSTRGQAGSLVGGQPRMRLSNALQVPQSPVPAIADPRSVPSQLTAPSQAERSGYGYPNTPPVLLNDASWTYQPAPPLRVFQKQDVVTIRVDEITRVMAEGNVDNRKRTLFDAIVNDWIKVINFRFIPQPMVEGEPGVAFQSQSNYRADASVESRESMTFNIAATVVDIRPNGNLVLEARKHIRINDNLWETSLTGICRAIDIGPDNVVLSKDLIDLEIRKEDQGQLRDGVSRGWFQRWVDRFGPF